MAKKDPSELSVEEKLSTLYQLQTTLSAIDEKRALRGELPLEVRDLEDEIAGLNTRMDHINAEIEDFRAAIAQKRNEIEQNQASVDRYKAQLDEVEVPTLELPLLDEGIDLGSLYELANLLQKAGA